MKTQQSDPSYLIFKLRTRDCGRIIRKNHCLFSSIQKPESKNANRFLAKRGVMVLGVCSMPRPHKESFGKYCILYLHLAYKDVDLFQRGSSLKIGHVFPFR